MAKVFLFFFFLSFVIANVPIVLYPFAIRQNHAFLWSKTMNFLAQITWLAACDCTKLEFIGIQRLACPFSGSFYESSFLHSFVFTLLVHSHLLPHVANCELGMASPLPVRCVLGWAREGTCYWRAGICTETVAGGERHWSHCEKSVAA